MAAALDRKLEEEDRARRWHAQGVQPEPGGKRRSEAQPAGSAKRRVTPNWDNAASWFKQGASGVGAPQFAGGAPAFAHARRPAQPKAARATAATRSQWDEVPQVVVLDSSDSEEVHAQPAPPRQPAQRPAAAPRQPMQPQPATMATAEEEEEFHTIPTTCTDSSASGHLRRLYADIHGRPRAQQRPRPASRPAEAPRAAPRTRAGAPC